MLKFLFEDCQFEKKIFIFMKSKETLIERKGSIVIHFGLPVAPGHNHMIVGVDSAFWREMNEFENLFFISLNVG